MGLKQECDMLQQILGQVLELLTEAKYHAQNLPNSGIYEASNHVSNIVELCTQALSYLDGRAKVQIESINQLLGIQTFSSTVITTVVKSNIPNLSEDERVSNGLNQNYTNEWQEGYPLPGYQVAQVDPRKFKDYSMNPHNPNNNGKWQAYTTIGYDLSTPESRETAAQDVINQLLINLSSIPAKAELSSEHGIRFEVKVPIQGPNGKRGILITKWQMEQGQPRLITNWLKVNKGDN
jgi:hypothetical protein